MPRSEDANIVINKKTKAKIDRSCKLKSKLDKRKCSLDFAINQAMDVWIEDLKEQIEEAKG